ncbi:MAG: ATP synthase F1 subunit epsilon [Traorella sp.]
MMKVKIVTPSGLYGEFEASQVHVTTSIGECTLLPHHMPLVATLQISKLILTIEGKPNEFAISSGILHLNDDQIHILVDACEGKEEIDLERAQRSAERARKRLEKKDSNTSIRRAEVSLQRAINRIHVKSGQ